MKELLYPMDGVVDVSVSLVDRSVWVTHRASVEPEEIVRVINTKHLGASIKESGSAAVTSVGLQRARVTGVVCAAQIVLFTLGAICMFKLGQCSQHCDDVFTNSLNGFEIAAVVLWGTCVLLSYQLFHYAALACLRLQPNMELLMSMAILGAIRLGDMMTASLVAMIVKSLEWITDCVVQYIDQRLKAMVVSAPEIATLTNGSTVELCEISPGTELVVTPCGLVVTKPMNAGPRGESVPVDGQVTAGEATIDESKVTGEAMHVLKRTGDELLAGGVVLSGFVHVCASSSVEESFQGTVAHAVDRAKDSSSHAQQLVAAVAKWYTPAVILMAAVVAAVELNFSCPCSLLGAAPLVHGTAIAMLASKHQLLFRSAAALEALATVKALGIDKTGTLTTGEFRLVEFEVFSGYDQDSVLRWAASVENADNHPIARYIVKSYAGCLIAAQQQLDELNNFSREGRCGVRGKVCGHEVGVGNRNFLETTEVKLHPQAQDLMNKWSSRGTVLFVTVDGQVAGVMLLSDTVRPESSAVVKWLHQLGVTPVMLTGDSLHTAAATAAQVGIKQLHPELLPEQKAKWVVQASHGDLGISAGQFSQFSMVSGEEQQTEVVQQFKMGSDHVGFIGDGLNDRVALARADVGIAMREVAESALVDASDAVLQGSLVELPSVIVFARRVRWLVGVNIALAGMLNLGFMGISIFWDVPLWVGAVCDNGSLLVVLLNSLWPLCWNVSTVDATTTEVSAMLHPDNKLDYKQRKAIEQRLYR